MRQTRQYSSLAVAVLALLYEAPMHPYRMQQLIKERHKDEVIDIRHRTSIYQAIARLERDGLVRVAATTRAEDRPERTVYALTDAGREETVGWIRTVLSSPAREFADFPAALSFVALLTPDDVLRQLRHRLDALDADIAHIDAQVAATGDMPRLFLLETEYLRATLLAQRAWVRAIVDDLAAGRISWNY
jgi:DNA-binding PadR family transcriptional regulator